MNKNFILTDKINNNQKGASTIIKFNLDEKDYLIYSIDENEQNKQIFVSKLILNSEGKYFIDNITPEEKNKLSNVVYNIVILTPSNAKKGGVSSDLIKNLIEKFNLKLSLECPELSEQEYYTNCSIAITGKEFVDDAIKFYSENLMEEKKPVEVNSETPTWTIPTSEETVQTPSSIETPTEQEMTTPIEIKPIPDIEIAPTTENKEPALEVPKDPVPTPVVETPSIVEPINVVAAEPVAPIPTVQQETAPVAAAPVPTVEKKEETPSVAVNPQTVVMSDPSLGINNNMQPNVAKKNAGFAVNKYVVIGTVCIIVAIAVVVLAYILISKKTTGI